MVIVLSMFALPTFATDSSTGVATEEEAMPADTAYSYEYDKSGDKPYLYGSTAGVGLFYYPDPSDKESGMEGHAMAVVFNLTDETGVNNAIAYCGDVLVDPEPGSGYRRLNLEDHYSPAIAAKIRAIVNHSFPKVDVSAIEEATGLTGLTKSEVITAAQVAIWKTVEGDKLDLTTGGMMGPYAAYFDGFEGGAIGESVNEPDGQDFPIGSGAELNRLGLRIKTVCDMFLALPGEAPTKIAVTDSSLKNIRGEWLMGSDGTVTQKVYATVDAGIQANDTLYIYADNGKQVLKQPVNARGEYWFEFDPVPSSEIQGVDICIAGVQRGNDVYVYKVPNAEDSQTMVGYENNEVAQPKMRRMAMRTITADAGTEVENPDRIVNITKLEEGTNRPLANVQFEIYYAGGMNDYLNGRLKIADQAVGAAPTAEQIAAIKATDPIVTLTTDANGFASYNFTENGQPDALYMVVEKYHPLVTEPVTPFFLPMPFPSNTSEVDYVVDISPKNVIHQDGVAIDKYIEAIDTMEATYHVDQTHTWIIESTVPYGMATAQIFEIKDALDSRLTWVGNLRVEAVKAGEEGAAETVTALTLDEDYRLILETDTEGKVTAFKVTLTPGGMAKAAGNDKLRVYFDTKINTTAVADDKITNQAFVDYTNNVGQVFFDQSEEPKVYTGALKLNKVDAADKAPLANASFKIARIATPAETGAGTYETVGNLNLVYVDFYTALDMSGDKVFEVTTDENGVAYFAGLAYGDYYLVETKAPNGYNKLADPIAVTIKADSSLDDDAATETVEGYSVTVANNTGALLPSTGGFGTTLIYTLGAILALGAMILLVTKRRMGEA